MKQNTRMGIKKVQKEKALLLGKLKKKKTATSWEDIWYGHWQRHHFHRWNGHGSSREI